MHHGTQSPIPHELIRDYDNRVIVAGTRDYVDYHYFCSIMDQQYQDYEGTVVFISGKARTGPDEMVIRWCQERGYDWAEFPADWDNIDVPDAVVRYNSHGKPYNVKAGLVRNEQMADYGNRLIVFWDERSSGTRHMREHAILRKLKVLTVLISLG